MSIDNNTPQESQSQAIPVETSAVVLPGEPEVLLVSEHVELAEVVQQQVVVEESVPAAAAVESSDDGSEEIPPMEAWTSPLTATQEYEVFGPASDKAPAGIEVAMPTDTDERVQKRISQFPNLDYSKSPTGENWSNILAGSSMSLQWGGGFRGALDREGSNYRQYVPSERGLLAVSVPKFRDSEPGAKLSGERAVLRVRTQVGLGSLVQVPLWHSGFWVTFKAPSEAAILELHRRLSEEKITLGRQTYGLAFSNLSVFFAGWLVDFFLSHLYDTTLHADLQADNEIRKHISLLDLPALAWGMACCIWPKGYPYARALVVPQAETPPVVKGMVNVGKMQWTDWASLSDWQKKHMANRQSGQVTKDLLTRYKDEFVRGQPRRIEVAPEVAVVLRVPTLEEYLLSGQQWVNNIVSMVDTAFGMASNEAARNSYITDQARATLMRQFSHWVMSVESGENNEIDHRETVDSVLDVLSESEEIAKKYREGVNAYQNDATISVIAVPAWDENEKSDLPRHPHLLPIDAMSVFFLLLVQKTLQIQQRG